MWDLIARKHRSTLRRGEGMWENSSYNSLHTYRYTKFGRRQNIYLLIAI